MSAVQHHASTQGLRDFAAALLQAAGLEADKAVSVARLLVLTDMMGRRTHGLAMLPLYAIELQSGGMCAQGRPEVVRDSGATLVWDGNYLPGLWLMEEAIRTAMSRIAAHGVVSVALRKTHHIGCLSALVKEAADQGCIALIANSDPAGKRVAPYGGKEALFTPNPMAFGYPGATHPVLIDMCASITTTSMTRQKFAAGEQFEHPWLQDANGVPTTDPAVLEHHTPRGALQLIGGQEYGHKGFGLALMIEALSQGLSGHGRNDAPTRWGGNVFLQVLDPAFFAGGEAFAAQTNHLADACRRNPPIHPAQPVRVPGDQAAKAHADALRDGVTLDPATLQSLRECARTFNVSPPF